MTRLFRFTPDGPAAVVAVGVVAKLEAGVDCPVTTDTAARDQRTIRCIVINDNLDGTAEFRLNEKCLIVNL